MAKCMMFARADMKMKRPAQCSNHTRFEGPLTVIKAPRIHDSDSLVLNISWRVISRIAGCWKTDCHTGRFEYITFMSLAAWAAIWRSDHFGCSCFKTGTI